MTPEQIVEFAEGLARIAASGAGPGALAAHLAHAIEGTASLEDAGWHPPPESGSSAVAVLKLQAGDSHAGWLFARGGAAEAPALGLLMRLTAAAIVVELARREGSGRGAPAFWERVISGAYRDVTTAREDAAMHDVALAPAYLAVALEWDAPLEGDATALPDLRSIASAAFRSSGDAAVGFLERGASLLAFVPSAREIDASNARTAATLLPKHVAKQHPTLHLSGGVGTVGTLAELRRSAQAAESALAIGRRMYGSGTVVTYEELGAYSLLYEGADVRHLQTFAAGVLAPLRAYDEKHATELERTLRLYFEVGQNVKTAAARLFVHRHTVFYRLRQIGDICDSSLDSPHDQLTLRLAVAIDALHSS
jgi:hypothetical protein